MSESEGEAIDTRALRRALGQFPTGVTIVTCRAADGTPVGMTANSFASVSLDPPLVLWSLDRQARSFEAFAAAQGFAFSVLGLDQVELSNRFAQPGADKFATVDWHTGEDDVPIMPDAAAVFECRTWRTYEGGDHLIIVGRVRRFTHAERNPLVFAQGRYGALAPHPGTVGEAAPGKAIAERHPYDDFLVPLLYRAYAHLFGGFSRSLVARETTGAQMRLLAVLSASGATDEDTLLTRTMLSQSSYAEARDQLLAAGLIQADGTAEAITTAGEERLAELLQHAAARERDATQPLDATEVELLRTLLQKLVRHHEGDG